ncbi:SRPBCC family protein [Aeromicrobium terrae]|uniref:SRPBCC family protein n=1 Tax=Aeromicrobium terrae TaxID=2498846 RepID=A0A5C8NLQ1_9ACTN|nr:SRPBCC family protein [Aeromicrobium terrae]TXL62178.1 SRPBCC family protein [Aeromicrobium terrae]
MAEYEAVLEQSIDVAAPPAAVWELVRDVTRMSEWSPQVVSTRLRSGFDEVAQGAEFTNKNQQGEMEWVTHGEVVRFEPERELAFRIQENWVVWSFRLDPTDAGTRLTQRRDTPDGISDLSLELTDGFLGGQEAFTQSLRDGMRQTLERIRDAAEGA